MHVMDGHLRAQDNGRKRHIAVHAISLLLAVLITAASVQDRDAARPLLWNLRKAFPTIKLAWADGGYAGKLVTWAGKALKLTLQIVRRTDDLHTFKVLPRRWVVERTWPGSPAADAPSATTNASPNTTRPSCTGP
jgi:transposase